MKTIPWTNRVDRLDVICPSAPWENETTDAPEATDLALSLSEDHGYCQVRQGGRIIAEYTDGSTHWSYTPMGMPAEALAQAAP